MQQHHERDAGQQAFQEAESRARKAVKQPDFRGFVEKARQARAEEGCDHISSEEADDKEDEGRRH